MRTFVIGEAGSCHEGSFNKACSLINLAHDMGCDAVKFQYCSDYEKLAERRGHPVSKYPFSIDDTWIAPLYGYCGAMIEFMCTTYLAEDIKVVAPYVKRFKVSAFEAKDEHFIGSHNIYGKPIIISGRNMYCVSKYPCPDGELYLNQMRPYAGLSDHSRNPLTGALAVGLCAQYIETHFRLIGTSPDCPDYCVARSPEELDRYVKNIREAEVLLYG